MNSHFSKRECCPGCSSIKNTILYEISYNDEKMINLDTFYGNQDGVKFE